ncbi:MAG TPA: DctP family TRAP transporter solute-binding subunit [Desulfobacteraceae bacterium]|nr:DctP family TRAP transporter solute-binding subunit [Desulfobacteraceae bacterium]
MKRLSRLFLFAATVIIFCQAGFIHASTTFKLATVTPPHHAYNEGAREFARLVHERTGGEVVVKVYAGGQLGKGERELLEGLQVGTIDMAVTSTGPVSNFTPDFAVLDLPFLFVSNTHVDRVLDGDVGTELLGKLESSGIKGLAFMENGFRNFTNSVRPLVQPGDFKGLKFRTMENPVHLAAVRQLGAKAIPMSWGEVYTALQTSVIDGQENPVAIVHSTKLNEVQKYLTLSGHFYSPAMLTMGLRKFRGLAPDLQRILIDAAVAAAVFEREVIRENEARQVEELKDWGMDVRGVDKEVFVRAMEPVYDKFVGANPHWKSVVERILTQK